MDCNKEEAIRAMDMAEKRMEKRDFVGAKRTAVKAQQLYPNLVNISQMILVCDVHCASQSKVYGNEHDWYGVLQIPPTADEAAIKKQFRKLALSLHPDKNKFAGAADAFKMIGEAQKVLLDREKRLAYDSRCKAAGRHQSSYGHTYHGSRQTNARGHPWFQSTFVNNTTSQFVNQQQPQQTQSAGVNDKNTFWTVCPFCSVKYQYYRDVLNRMLLCQTCKKEFTGYEMNPPGGNPQTNSHRPVFPPQTGAAKKGNSSKTGSKNQNRDSIPVKKFTPEVGKESNGNKNQESKSSNVRSSNKFRDSKRRGRKRKTAKESSESCDIESSSDSDEDVDIKECGDNLFEQNSAFYNDQYLRRSTRSKQRVSYDENPHDEGGPSAAGVDEGGQGSSKKEPDPATVEEENREVKRKKVSAADETSRNGDNKTEKTGKNAVVSEDDEGSSEPKNFAYVDPDFSDFEKDRKEECFAVGQLWAVYDILGAMPRFYAIVRKVISRSFKLRITWLEPYPDDDEKQMWVDEGLPASCGKFVLGHSEVTDQHAMFSHLVLEKIGKKVSFEIYPKKGETWALFKGWDINWHSDPERKNDFDYDYEFVEILSEYTNECGVQVAFLGKLKGFASLFCRVAKDGIDPFTIPAKHIYRFSHKVPSFQMSGEERLDVPQGSFELDPASLPGNLDEIDVLTALSMDPGQMHRNGSCSKPDKDTCKPRDSSRHSESSAQFVDLKVGPGETVTATPSKAPFSATNEDLMDAELKCESILTSSVEEVAKEDRQNANCNGAESVKKENSGSLNPAAAEEYAELYEVPEPEFHDFYAERSIDKFQVGQIWAVYSDEDALPKYYGKIKQIDSPHSPPSFAVHLTWFVALPPSKDVIHWTDKKMPVSCGEFKQARGTQMFVGTLTFSHQLRALHDEKKNVYGIYPEKGDIWALYKNWRAGMTCSDLDTCEYEPVEILDRNEVETTVLVLELVTGFKSVFKPSSTRKIPRAELFRFSHQIPAFRLTDEKDGSLKGFWELDPAALPISFFKSS